MEILQKEISGDIKSYININGVDILLEKSPTDSVYSGFLSQDQTIPLNDLLTTLITPKRAFEDYPLFLRYFNYSIQDFKQALVLQL